PAQRPGGAAGEADRTAATLSPAKARGRPVPPLFWPSDIRAGCCGVLPGALQPAQLGGGLGQLALVEHLHPVAAEQGGGDAFALDQGAAEAAVVVVAVAAGRAARLGHGYAQTVLRDQTQGARGTSDEGGRDIGAGVGQHRRTAGERRATLAAGNFRWRPWRRQAGGQLGTRRD